MSEFGKKMLVKKGAVVIRNGDRVRPEIGKNFDFSAEEVEQLNEATPGTLVAAASAEDGAAKVASTSKGKAGKAGKTKAASNAERSQAGAKDGKKDATANKADGESGDDDL